MKINYLKMFIFVCMTIVLNVLLVNENSVALAIDIGAFSLPILSLLAGFLYIIMIFIKPKTSVIFNFNRINLSMIFLMMGYYFFLISGIAVFIYFYEISLWLGIIMLVCEFMILLLLFACKMINTEVALLKDILKYKDAIYITMMFILILQNMPFAIYAIPVDILLSALYATYLVYVVYRLITLVYNEQKIN